MPPLGPPLQPAHPSDVIPGGVHPIDAPGTGEGSWQAWPELAELPVLALAGWDSVAIAAAHPDDEVLGAGGTMALLAAAGARLRIISITDGEASHPGVPAADVGRRRADELAAALAALGAADAEVIRLGMPDAGLSGLEPELTASLRELTAGFDVCLAPWDGDLHADHETAGRAARGAGGRVLFYPVWMWHWARPGDPRVGWQQAARIPLPEAAQHRKHAAIRCFRSQLEDTPAGKGPVLAAPFVAHFTRGYEVLLPGTAS